MIGHLELAAWIFFYSGTVLGGGNTCTMLCKNLALSSLSIADTVSSSVWQVSVLSEKYLHLKWWVYLSWPKRYRNMGRVSALTSQASFWIVSVYQPHRFARDSLCPSLPFPPSPKKRSTCSCLRGTRESLLKDPTTALNAGRGTANRIENTACIWYFCWLADVKSSIKKSHRREIKTS